MGNCGVNLVGSGRFFLFPKALPLSTVLLFPCDHTLHLLDDLSKQYFCSCNTLSESDQSFMLWLELRFEGSTQLMDEYFGKRAIDGVVVPRKGMGHASRDTTNARDRNAQEDYPRLSVAVAGDWKFDVYMGIDKFVHGMIDGVQKIT
ncbi:hypothetical protein JHK87_055229 [Glycine soja]|nr:hypothetical protein JHK87_055229 [Glycine soja]